MQDPYPLSGLRWGASFAISGDASVVLVGAPGQVISGALTTGVDRAIDGKVTSALLWMLYTVQRCSLPAVHR